MSNLTLSHPPPGKRHQCCSCHRDFTDTSSPAAMSCRAGATSRAPQWRQACAYLPKSHVFFVQVGSWLEGDVELRAVAVAALVGHPKDPSSLVTDREAFI